MFIKVSYVFYDGSVSEQILNSDFIKSISHCNAVAMESDKRSKAKSYVSLSDGNDLHAMETPDEIWDMLRR